MDVEVIGDIPVMFNRFANRLDVLRNHLNHYIFVIMQDDTEPVHFNLADVSLITFLDDSFEIILRDSGTVYFKYHVINNISLLKVDS